VNDLSEKEQLEEMRAWWSENGRFVITGIVLGVVIIVSWNQWRSSITTSQVTASNLFEEVMQAADAGDLAAAEEAANDLFENYGQTVYPAQTRLALARLYMDRGRDQDAVDVLRELAGQDGTSELQLVARLRLAKVLLYQNKPEQVVELLQDHGQSGFAARFSEVLGDAYAAQGNYAGAQSAYEDALRDNQAVQTIDSNLIQLKLNDLPDPAELATTSAAIAAAIDAGEIVDGTDVDGTDVDRTDVDGTDVDGTDEKAQAADDPAAPAAVDPAEPEPESGQ